MTNATTQQAITILATARALVEAARKLDPDLQDNTEASNVAAELRVLLDPLRICSECGQATGNITDVCTGCWPAYRRRCEDEDRAAGIFDDDEPDPNFDTTHFCEECGCALTRLDGPRCTHCEDEASDEATAAAQAAEDELDDARECADGYDPDLDEERDRDWEQEQRVVDEAWTDMMVGQGEE